MRLVLVVRTGFNLLELDGWLSRYPDISTSLALHAVRPRSGSCHCIRSSCLIPEAMEQKWLEAGYRSIRSGSMVAF
eukprot:scaffold597734_cov106-Attheya_sp.AAC.3